MHRHVLGQIDLETELRTVIEERRLRVFYQPVVNLLSGGLAGFEALTRWPAGPDQISPTRFIAVAEDAGLIADLGQLVLERACERLSDWRRRRVVGEDMTVSVNVSARQLSHPQRLVDDVETALRGSGLPATCLRLEITESTVISRPERARVALEQLARLGVRAEIDDFGTGYASLTVLQSFAGDTLKIDRSFIGTMHEEEGHHAIVRGIVALAHNLACTSSPRGSSMRSSSRCCARSAVSTARATCSRGGWKATSSSRDRCLGRRALRGRRASRHAARVAAAHRLSGVGCCRSGSRARARRRQRRLQHDWRAWHDLPG